MDRVANLAAEKFSAEDHESAHTEQSLFLQVFQQSDKPAGNTDREYGVPSPARKLFNEAFDDFRKLNQDKSPEEALAGSSAKMTQSIEQADDYVERSQSVFYKQIAAKEFQDSKPSAELIEKLQLLSAALTGVLPGKREDLMRDLAKGITDKLDQNDEVKEAYEKIPAEYAATDKTALIKSWLDYRAGLGDAIGQRLVFAGLQRRFGSRSVADRQDTEVTALKNRVGGRFVFD